MLADSPIPIALHACLQGRMETFLLVWEELQGTVQADPNKATASSQLESWSQAIELPIPLMLGQTVRAPGAVQKGDAASSALHPRLVELGGSTGNSGALSFTGGQGGSAPLDRSGRSTRDSYASRNWQDMVNNMQAMRFTRQVAFPCHACCPEGWHAYRGGCSPL